MEKAAAQPALLHFSARNKDSRLDYQIYVLNRPNNFSSEKLRELFFSNEEVVVDIRSTKTAFSRPTATITFSQRLSLPVKPSAWHIPAKRTITPNCFRVFQHKRRNGSDQVYPNHIPTKMLQLDFLSIYMPGMQDGQ